MKGLNNSQELRKQIQNLAEARESLEGYNDISGSMVKVSHALNSIKPLMDKQTDYIKNFHSVSTQDSNSKQSQTRRYVSRICDISLNEITQLLNAGQQYFSLEIKNSWNKLRNQYERLILIEKQKGEKVNIAELLFKLMNMKDKIMKDFLRSLIYRKCLLWRDLNIISSDYVHFQKKRITKLIEDNILNRKYAPTKPFFQLPPFEEPGQWSINKIQLEDAPLSEFFKLLSEEVEETYSTIRNYSGLNQQQRNHEDIRRNKQQILSLRGEIEQAHINYQLLEKKYRQAINRDQKLDMVEMKERLHQLQETVESRDQELKMLKFEYRDYTINMNAQKQKIKELETDLDKIKSIEMKKLKQIQLQQFTLSDQVNRIANNMNSFGSMFEFQSEGKRSLAESIISHKEKMQKMAVILGRHKNENRDLKQEIQRLNTVIIQLGLQINQLKK